MQVHLISWVGPLWIFAPKCEMHDGLSVLCIVYIKPLKDTGTSGKLSIFTHENQPVETDV